MNLTDFPEVFINTQNQQMKEKTDEIGMSNHKAAKPVIINF